MLADIKEFHMSTSRELDTIKNRVRNLIGDTNWGDEGRYKEVVLKNIIRKFLPGHYGIGTGFVVKENSGQSHHISKQIDLIIYDTSLPLLFSEGDFIITTPAPVLGIIEVKTNIENLDIRKVIEKANEIGRFVYEGKIIVPKPLFNGIFSYEGYHDNYPDSIDNRIRESASAYKSIISNAKLYLVNHISLNKNCFIKYWWGSRHRYSLYQLRDLSFSYFISNLMHFITEKDLEMENDNSLWFPVDKEYQKRRDVYLFDANHDMEP